MTRLSETPFSLNHLHTLLVAARDHPLEAFFGLALLTGMRTGELQILTWNDVDLEQGTIQVPPLLLRQTHSHCQSPRPARIVPLASVAWDLVRTHRQRQAPEQSVPWMQTPLLFRAASGRPLQIAEDLLPAWKELQQQADIPHRRLHTLRSSVLYQLFALHTPQPLVQEMLGMRWGNPIVSSLAPIPLEQYRAAYQRLQEAIEAAKESEEADGRKNRD